VVMDGLQHHFSRVLLQAFLFAWSLLESCEVSASPRAKGNKKAQVTPSPRSSGQWPTAPSVGSFYGQVVYKHQRPRVCTAYYMLGRTLQLVSYPTLCLRTLSRFFCHLLLRMPRQSCHRFQGNPVTGALVTGGAVADLTGEFWKHARLLLR